MPAAIAIGADAPEFSLRGLDGAAVRFAGSAGEFTFINFFKST